MLNQNKTILPVPKYKTEVVIEFVDGQFEIDYIPNSDYTEEELKTEVELIINKILETV